MIEAEPLHYSLTGLYYMTLWLTSFLHAQIQCTPVVGTPFCDNATHHSNELIYPTSTESVLSRIVDKLNE